ncbi:MAG: response regulator [Myxococcales bacterium]|nr:response regulator [Myxococcales bacterium]
MARPLNVLLAEDDDPLREVLLELLAQRGWQVHAAARGDEAVELAQRIEPDLSILDFHLPGLTGLEVFRRIVADIRPIPAIMISGDASREEALAALDAGFVEFLRKPLDLKSFRDTLDSVAQRLDVGGSGVGDEPALHVPAGEAPDARVPGAVRAGAARGSSRLLPTRLEDLHLFELLTFSMSELAARGLSADALAQIAQVREMLRGSIRFPEDEHKSRRLQVDARKPADPGSGRSDPTRGSPPTGGGFPDRPLR